MSRWRVGAGSSCLANWVSVSDGVATNCLNVSGIDVCRGGEERIGEEVLCVCECVWWRGKGR